MKKTNIKQTQKHSESTKRAYMAPTFEIIDIEITQNILGDSKGDGKAPGFWGEDY